MKYKNTKFNACGRLFADLTGMAQADTDWMVYCYPALRLKSTMHTLQHTNRLISYKLHMESIEARMSGPLRRKKPNTSVMPRPFGYLFTCSRHEASTSWR